MHQNNATAYAKISRHALTGRELEATVLSECANDMVRGLQRLNDHPAHIREALLKNQQAWAILGGSAADEDNPLPPELKSNLVKLTYFVFKHTDAIISHERPFDEQSLAPLINMNRNIAAGLRGQATDEAQPARQSSAPMPVAARPPAMQHGPTAAYSAAARSAASGRAKSASA